MIVAFHSLAFFVETPLLAWSEHVRARWFSAASLAVLALSAFAAAMCPSRWSLLLALAVYGPASGCALAVAEGLVVEAEPHSRERAMARLSLAANAGDLAVPLLLAILTWYGLGWRAGFVVAGALASLLAIAHGSARSLDRVSSAARGDSEGHAPSIRETLRMAFATRPLLGWSFACASTNLLDEVLVAFSAVHLHALGATLGQRSWAVAAWILGGFVGLAGLERLAERSSGRRVLLGAAAVTAIAVTVLAVTHSTGMGTCALFVIGATGSTLHPLAKAKAGRCRTGPRL
jgi:MFS family permease